MLTVFMLCSAGRTAVSLAPVKDAVIELDLGKVRAGGSASGDLRFSVPIKTAVALCDCLSFTIFREGKENRLEVVFDGQGYEGETWQELIAVNEDDRRIRIRVHAFVEKSAGERRSDSDKLR